MKSVPRQPRSRSKTAIILCGRPSSFGYYFWRLGEAVAGEPLARRGEEAAEAVDEPLVVVPGLSLYTLKKQLRDSFALELIPR